MEKGQRFRLKWKNQQPTVISGFSSLLENEKLLDMTLAAGDQRLKAHRLVLSACSPYFEKLLSNEFDKHPVLMLREDIKFEELKAIMDYMYKGEVDMSLSQIDGFLKAAKALQIKGLNEHEICEKSTNTKRSPDDGECSVSTIAPGPNKKQRLTRHEWDNNACQASTSSNTQSLAQNISSSSNPSGNIKMKSDKPSTIETEPKNLTHYKNDQNSQPIRDINSLMDMQKNDKAKRTELVEFTSNEGKFREVFLTARDVVERKNSELIKVFIKKKCHKMRMSRYQIF